MIRYKDFQPTGFDPKGCFLPDKQEWFVAPVSRTRDSGPLEESNFESCLEQLGGEGKNVQVHRFGHWGPGWFEIILVYPMSSKVKILEDIERSLSDYPVLDETKLSEMEEELKDEAWQSWGDSELEEVFKEASKLPIEDCVVELDTEKARFYCYSAMEFDADGSSPILRLAEAKRLLLELCFSKFWEILKVLRITRAAFDDLPHDIYHMLFQAGVHIFDIDTKEPLEVPDFISVQYCEDQMKLFP